MDDLSKREYVDVRVIRLPQERRGDGMVEVGLDGEKMLVEQESIQMSMGDMMDLSLSAGCIAAAGECMLKEMRRLLDELDELGMFDTRSEEVAQKVYELGHYIKEIYTEE